MTPNLNRLVETVQVTSYLNHLIEMVQIYVELTKIISNYHQIHPLNRALGPVVQNYKTNDVIS